MASSQHINPLVAPGNKYSLDRRERWILAAITLLGLFLRLLLVWLSRHDAPGGDEPLFILAARNLAHGIGFSFPDGRLPCAWTPGMPTAARAPGPAFWLAAWFLVAGENLLLPRLVVAVLSGLCSLLLFDLGATTHSKRAGFFAAALWAVGFSEVFSWYGVVTLIGEPLSLVLVIAALSALVKSLQRENYGVAAVAGCFLALASYLRPTCLTLLFPVLLWALMFRRTGPTLRLIGLALACQVLLILPWTVRNKVQLGAFVPIASYSGTNFYIANNPLCLANKGAVNENDPPLEPEVVARMRQLPEAEASNYCTKRAIEFLRSHPRDGVYLACRRMLLLFDPSLTLATPFGETTIVDGHYALLAVGALLALWLCRASALTWLYALWSVNFIWPHLLFQAHPRYRQMLDPTVILLAASTLAVLWGRGRVGRALVVSGIAGGLVLSLFSTQLMAFLRSVL